MGKWKIILPVALAVLLLVAIPLAVFAQNDAPQAPAKVREFKGGLALVAPRVAAVGQQMQMTVLLRWNQTPVEGVGIWAVSKENIETLQAEIKELRDNKAIAETDKDYEAIIKLHAKYLGATDNKGRLTHTFDTAGNLVLVAFKKTYWPDWSPIGIRELPKALEIKNPLRTAAGKDTKIQVTFKRTNLGVEGAGVWAVSANKTEAVKAEIEAFRAANQANPSGADWEGKLDAIARRLGKTGENGVLVTKFEDAGRYLLISYKPGFIPGLSGIAVVAPQPTTANVTRK